MAEKVEVTIVGGKISVDQLTLDLSGKGPNVQIHWKILTPQWEFTANGIEIPTNTGQFDQPERQGQNFKWKDKNSDGRTYKYTINVFDGTTGLTEDPFIVNA